MRTEDVWLDRRRDGRGIELARVRVEPHGWSVLVADAFTALAVLSGSGTMQWRGEVLPIGGERRDAASDEGANGGSGEPGDARLIAPLELFVLRTEATPLEVAMVHAPPSLVPRRRGDATSPGALAQLTRWLSMCCSPPPGARAPESFAEVLELLADAGAARRGRVRPGTLEPGPVRRARHYLETHYDSLPTLDDLASEVGTSKFHLVRMFRAYHGVPPHTYLIWFRIALARKMIAAGERGADTALATGFADQSHFSRSFRRVMGMSPLEYARLGIAKPARRRSSGMHPTIDDPEG